MFRHVQPPSIVARSSAAAFLIDVPPAARALWDLPIVDRSGNRSRCRWPRARPDGMRQINTTGEISLSATRRPGRRGVRAALMLAFPHIAEQESRDFPLLDFLAAFGDAVAAVVAVDVFERLVA